MPAAPGPGRPDRGCRPGGRPRAGRHPLAVGRGGEGPTPAWTERGGEGPRPGREAGRRRGGARREAETTLVDMYTTSGISAGDQGEHARAALWFANAARRAKADPDRRLANAVRARTWGRRAFTPLHAVVADGSWPGRPGLPSGRAPPDHEGRDRRQDLGYSQHALGPGDRAVPPIPRRPDDRAGRGLEPRRPFPRDGPRGWRRGRRPLPRRRAAEPHPVPGAHPAPGLQHRWALPGDRRRKLRSGLGCRVTHLRHPGAGRIPRR